jgi:hypothetical protein
LFLLKFVVSLSLPEFITSINDGAHPLAQDALAEMPEDSFLYVLALPPTAHIFPAAREERDAAGLL